MTIHHRRPSVPARTRVLAAWMLSHHHWMALLLLVSCFAPLLWIAQYNYPSGDAYANFAYAQSLGTFGAVRWVYLNWTGRYSSFLLQSLFPEYDTWLVAYTVIPIALFAAGFGCLYYFARAFFGGRFAPRELLTFTSLAYVFLVSSTPDIPTAFYWMPTNVQYLGALFTTLLILGLYIDLERASAPSVRAALGALTMILIAFLAGLNEISIVLFIAIMAVVSLCQFVTLKRRPTLSLALLAVAIVFALVSFLAPGNVVRASHTAKHVPLVTIPLRAVASTVYLFIELLAVPPLLLASGVYLAFLETNRDRLAHLWSWLADIRWHWVLAFVFCTFTFTNAALNTATGMPIIAERVKNLYLYNLILGWFFLVTVVFVHSPSLTFSMPRWVIGLLGTAVMLFLIIGREVRLTPGTAIAGADAVQRLCSVITAKGVYSTAYLDVCSGRAALFGRQNEEITTRFKAAAGGCVELPLPSHVPQTLFVGFVKYPSRWCASEFIRSQQEGSP